VAVRVAGASREGTGREFPLQRLPEAVPGAVQAAVRAPALARVPAWAAVAAGAGVPGRLRRNGLRLWSGFRRGHRPRPGFRRLRPWSGRRPRRRLRVRRPRRRLRVRRPRHWQPLRSRDWRRLHRFGVRLFRPCRLRLAGIVGYFARVHCGSAGGICCHPGIVPRPVPATRAAAASGQVACTRVRVSRFVRDDSVGVGGAMLVTDRASRPAGGRVSTRTSTSS